MDLAAFLILALDYHLRPSETLSLTTYSVPPTKSAGPSYERWAVVGAPEVFLRATKICFYQPDMDGLRSGERAWVDDVVSSLHRFDRRKVEERAVLVNGAAESGIHDQLPVV